MHQYLLLSFEQRSEGIFIKLSKDTVACFLRAGCMFKGKAAIELGPGEMTHPQEPEG